MEERGTAQAVEQVSCTTKGYSKLSQPTLESTAKQHSREAYF